MYTGNDLTEKQWHVVNLLIENEKMSTKDIIDDYAEYMEDRDTISPRHVQRTRKWYLENKHLFGKGDKKMNDYYDKQFIINDGETEFTYQESMVINMANKGGFSIQDIARHTYDEESFASIELVKEIINEYKDDIVEPVIDNDTNEIVNVSVLEDDKSEITKETLELAGFKDNGSDDFWEVEIDCVTACSKVANSIDVFVNTVAMNKAKKFMVWAKQREWLAYLVGEKKDDGFHVSDLYLPEQNTSPTLVNNVIADKYNQMSIIGVIHSHHEMGAGDADNPSFSGHDANFINGNHDLSLLAGRDRKNGGFKIVGIARAKTPCGGLMKVKANVKREKEDLSDNDKALKNEFFRKAMGEENEGYHFINKDEMRMLGRG